MSFTSSTGGTTSFVYDTTAGIPAVIDEVTPDGSVYYVREPGGELIARVSGVTGQILRYCHFDELGSTRMLTDGSGSVTDSYSYDAWGNVTNHTGESAQPYQFVGQLGYYTHVQDENLPLLQLGVRFYDPEVGRFTQVDVIAEFMHRYDYSQDRPSYIVDPSGKSPLILGGLILAELGVAAYDCIMNALHRAEEYHARNDKLAHCYMACRAARCLGGGLCQTYLIPLLMSHGENDPYDREANRRGGACARDQWLWPFNKYRSCYECCRAKVRGLPNDPGVMP